MLLRFKYILPVLVMFLISACSEGSREERLADWYTDTKEEILDQSDEKPDSTFEHIDLNNSLYEKWYYYKNRPVKYEVTNAAKTPRYIAFIAADSNFRFIQEYCPHGKLSYEGIEYQHKPYGTATWYDCETGKIVEQGNRFKFTKTGTWKKYNPDGSVKSTIEHKGKIKPGKLPTLD